MSSAGTAMDITLAYSLSGGDNGSVTSTTNNQDAGRNQAFTYDPLNRILSAVSQAATGADCWGQKFGPDGIVADDVVGNFSKINSGTQANPTCPFGSLASVGVDSNNHLTGTSFAYDAVGNMTGDGQTGVVYTFDDEGRMIKATPSGGPYCYVYDGNGLRVAKIQGGTGPNCSGGAVTKIYWRSIAGDSLTETDGSGSVTANYTEYVMFTGRRIASRVTGSNSANTALFYYFADQLGSTRTITTGSGKNNDGTSQTPGQLCYDQDYTPYGQEVFTTAQMSRLQTTACPPNYKFTGYERDSETGLDYAFARYYSSRLARFLSTDPLGGSIGNLQSHNAYAYVTNNPLNSTDPFGMDSCSGLSSNQYMYQQCEWALNYGYGGNLSGISNTWDEFDVLSLTLSGSSSGGASAGPSGTPRGSIVQSAIALGAFGDPTITIFPIVDPLDIINAIGSSSGHYYQIGAGVNLGLFFLTLGGGGGGNGGISTNGTLCGTALFLTEQVQGMVGAGLYAGVSTSAGVGRTSQQITSSYGQIQGYGEINVAWGPSAGIGGNYDFEHKSLSTQAGAPLKVFPGLGVGIDVGVGPAYVSTEVSPSVGEILHRLAPSTFKACPTN